jgi:hypothetical protein
MRLIAAAAMVLLSMLPAKAQETRHSFHWLQPSPDSDTDPDRWKRELAEKAEQDLRAKQNFERLLAEEQNPARGEARARAFKYQLESAKASALPATPYIPWPETRPPIRIEIIQAPPPPPLPPSFLCLSSGNMIVCN